MKDWQQLSLSSATRAPCDDVLRDVTKSVNEALVALAAPEPLAVVAFWLSDFDDLAQSGISCCTADYWSALVAQADAPRYRTAWDPLQWDYEDVPFEDPRDTPGFERMAATAAEVLRAAGAWDPTRTILDQVGRVVRLAPPVPVSDDFLAFTTDLEMGVELMHSIRVTASEEVAARLRKARLLADDPLELEEAAP